MTLAGPNSQRAKAYFAIAQKVADASKAIAAKQEDVFEIT